MQTQKMEKKCKKCKKNAKKYNLQGKMDGPVKKSYVQREDYFPSAPFVKLPVG